MKNVQCDRFWEGGKRAWWRGLKDAITAAKERQKTVSTEDEQREAQARLDELKRQEADADQNGDRWLF